MKKLNPFKPFIVLGLTIMYAAIFLITCAFVGAATMLSELPTNKAILLSGCAFIWFGLAAAIIACHAIIIRNRSIPEVSRGL